MIYPTPLLALSLVLLGAGTRLFGDDAVVFKDDVSLVRVDVQVLDADKRAIIGLRAEDFVLKESGVPQKIRNFAREDMPVDVLFLFDVSASMGPHVRRIVSAGHEAMQVLGDKDRVGIMVFDRRTRVRLPFSGNLNSVESELDRMMRQESFNGGTDITGAMLDASNYVRLHARPGARRAIVILTDDQTELERNDAAVERALTRADAVLSALIAPDAMGTGGYGAPPMGGNSPAGSTWPGGGLGGSLGGIILGRRGGYGRQGPGMGGGGPHTESAGTSEIAQDSGGDSMSVDDAAALQTTLERIRQRYALHFFVPENARAGEERQIEVQLSATARRRYPDAQLRFRHSYIAPTGSGGPGKSQDPDSLITTREPNAVPAAEAPNVSVTSSTPAKHRRVISEPDGPSGPAASTSDGPTPP